MIELPEPTRKVVYGTPEIMKADTTRFNEGFYRHKRNGKYYYSYTCLKNPTHHDMYAMGDNPYDPSNLKDQWGQDHKELKIITP